MCRLYSFRSNEPTKVECTLVHAQNALLLQSENDEIGRSHPDGWGIALYDNKSPQLEKNSAAAFEGLHFSDTAERIYSETVVSHVRLATVGQPVIENCHPFQWGRWVFAHNGTVRGIETLRSELSSEVSAELRQSIRGSTDSELLFHWLLQRALNADAINENECLDLDRLTDIIAGSITELDSRCHRACPSKPAKLNTVLTNGNVLLASRLRNSMSMVRREGIRDCEICGIPHVEHDPNKDYRAVVIASEPLSHESWEAIPDAHLVVVDPSLHVSIRPLPVSTKRVGYDSGLAKASRTSVMAPPASEIAKRLLEEDSGLRLDPLFESVRCKGIQQHGTLHVDDFSMIPNTVRDVNYFYQERARLRAVGGDWLATAKHSPESYEAYCQEYLGLAPVSWVQPNAADPIRLAEACWTDRSVRRQLVQAIRHEDLRYIHPHMGTQAIWELALMLHQASHRPVDVIAPPPGVTKFVNDKGEFVKLARMVLGDHSVPPSHVAWNVATAASRLRTLADTDVVTAVLKIPDAAGGAGNLLLSLD